MRRGRAAAAAVVAAAAAAPALACYDACRFTFCGGVGAGVPYAVGVAADAAFTPAICDGDRRVHVGHVDSTGAGYVVADGVATPLADWAPAGLSQPFAETFFKSYSLGGDWGDLSGIGHQVPQGNQAEYLGGDECFVVPLKSYQVYGDGVAVVENMAVVENVHPTEDLVDCVSFRTALGAADDGAPPLPPAAGTLAPATAAPATAVPEEDDAPVTMAPEEEDAPVTMAPAAPMTMAPAAPVTTPAAPKATTATEPMSTTASPVTTAALPKTTTAALATTAAAPATTAAAPATTAAAPATTAAAPVTTTAATAPTESTYMPPATTVATELLPDAGCVDGCPAPDFVRPLYSKCAAALGGRAAADFWVFAAADGGSSAGKSCGTANSKGEQLCRGTFKNVEWCDDAGFGCGEDSYRPQLVQCVSPDGEICRLSATQLEDIILEKVENGSDFFISCTQ